MNCAVGTVIGPACASAAMLLWARISIPQYLSVGPRCVDLLRTALSIGPDNNAHFSQASVGVYGICRRSRFARQFRLQFASNHAAFSICSGSQDSYPLGTVPTRGTRCVCVSFIRERLPICTHTALCTG